MQDVKWAHPGALGLAGFGFNTVLLQIHNLGLFDAAVPLIYGFFWGGLAQVIAGIVDARRGDTFGFTAFVSYGMFWIGLSLMYVMGSPFKDAQGLGWAFILWGIFTAYMAVAATKVSKLHVFIFVTLTLLFGLLAAVKFGVLDVKVAAVEGLFCGAAAIYGSAAVMMQDKFGKWVLPIGLPKS